MAHVMIDLETWGTKPGSMVRSIGAVVFDPETGDFGDEFYANICDASQEVLGLTKDPSTEAWWAEQSAAAQAALLADQRTLPDVLGAFNRWFTAVGGEQVWGHGANFDPVLLESAFNACLLDAPWQFWNVRCCRTVLAAGNRRPDRRATDTHHNALHDAKAQARAVAAAFRYGKFSPA